MEKQSNKFGNKFKTTKILLGINLKQILRYKPTIIIGSIVLVLNILLLLIGAHTGKTFESVLTNSLVTKSIYYIIVLFTFGLFMSLVSLFFYKKHINEGILNIELRAGINIWNSFFLRYVLSMIVILMYVTIYVLISLPIIYTGKLDSDLVSKIQVPQILFLYFFAIVVYPFITIITSLFTSAIGTLLNIVVVLAICFTPMAIGLSTKLSNTGSFEKYEKTKKLSLINKRYELGSDFYQKFKNHSIMKDVFTDSKPYGELGNLFNQFSKDDGKISNNLLARALFMGQSSLESYTTKDNVLKNWKIYDDVLKPIYEVTKDYKSDTTIKNLDSNYLFGSFTNQTSRSPLNLKVYSNFLKGNEKTKNLSELFDYATSVYDKYWYGLANESYISNYSISFKGNSLLPRVVGTTNLILGETGNSSRPSEEDKHDLEYNKGLFNFYNEHPELMVMNFLVTQLYNVATNFDNFNFVDVFKTYQEDLTFENALEKYNSVYNKANQFNNINFLGNFSWIYRGYSNDPFYMDYFYSDLSTTFITPYEGIKYITPADIQYAKEKSASNQLLKNFEPIFDSKLKAKGGINYWLSVLCWIVATGIFILFSALIFKRKSKI